MLHRRCFCSYESSLTAKQEDSHVALLKKKKKTCLKKNKKGKCIKYKK